MNRISMNKKAYYISIKSRNERTRLIKKFSYLRYFTIKSRNKLQNRVYTVYISTDKGLLCIVIWIEFFIHFSKTFRLIVFSVRVFFFFFSHLRFECVLLFSVKFQRKLSDLTEIQSSFIFTWNFLFPFKTTFWSIGSRIAASVGENHP